MTYKYEWGSFAQGEDHWLESEVEQNSTYDMYFTATGSQPIYTNFILYEFTDDLDLALYQYNANLDRYTQISVSQEEGVLEEAIFKGLTPGDYILKISHYSDLDYSSAASPFRLLFNSVDFYQNSVLPNDALFANQWHLLNNGQAGGADNEDVLAPEAWDIRSTSPDVVVAVIDTGFQLSHPDLDDNLWVNSDEIFGNGIDDDNNGYIDDIHGWNFPADSNAPYANTVSPFDHGTHVAGIIGAEGNNGIGTAGVTWDVQLMSLDVFNGEEYYQDLALLNAIYYAADNGADVINMSLGGKREYTTLADWKLYDPIDYSNYYEALSYAVDQGATVVIAAGNEDAHAGTANLSIPAVFSSSIDGVISVAAVSNTGVLTDYTNYGSLVTIAAPGGSHGSGAGILSTVPWDMYEGKPGTSMASPIVAGTAALIKAENPNLTPAGIEMIITDSAKKYRDMSSLVEDGNYLNLKDALALAQTYQPVGVPVNRKWSKHLWKKSGKDGIIDYYADKKGKLNKKQNDKITKKTLSFIDDMLDKTGSILGLDFNKVRKSKHADIIFQHKKKYKYASIDKAKYGMEISFGPTLKEPSVYDMQDIASFTGLALGLKNLEGESYDKQDSIMATNYSSEYRGWSNNDINALKSIW